MGLAVAATVSYVYQTSQVIRLAFFGKHRARIGKGEAVVGYKGPSQSAGRSGDLEPCWSARRPDVRIIQLQCQYIVHKKSMGQD